MNLAVFFKDLKTKILDANLVQTVLIGTFHVNPLFRWVLIIAKRLPPTYKSIINDVASFGNVNLYKPNKTTWDDAELYCLRIALKFVSILHHIYKPASRLLLYTVFILFQEHLIPLLTSNLPRIKHTRFTLRCAVS